MNMKVIKIASIGLSVLGAAVSLAASFIGEKQLDAKVAEKVTEALTSNK